jgi:hypothetical protein|eukprot:COSAG02_NODE_2751_length_8098_cov_4.799600_9_plen_55_part_00
MNLLGFSREHTWISHGRERCKVVAEARDQYALPRPVSRTNASCLTFYTQTTRIY